MSAACLAAVMMLSIVGTPAAHSGAADEPAKPAEALPPGAVARLGSIRLSHPGGVRCLQFMPGGKQLVSLGNDSTLRFWDLKTGQATAAFGKPVEMPAAARLNRGMLLDVSRDGKFLAATADLNQTIAVWSVEKGEPVASFTTAQPLGTGFALNHDGSRLAITDPNGKVQLWDVAAKKELAGLNAQEVRIASVVVPAAYSSDGKSLVTGGDLAVKLWSDLEKDSPSCVEIGSHRDAVIAAAISDDGKRVVSCGLDGKVRVWDVADKKQIKNFDLADMPRGIALQRGPAAAVQISADGAVVSGCSSTGTLRIWSVESGKLLASFSPGPNPLPAAQNGSQLGAIDAEGKWAAVGSPAGQIEIYDLKTGKQISDFEGHSGGVNLAVVSHGGRMAATGGVDATIRLWDLATGKQQRVLEGHIGAISYLQFTADGKHLFSASGDVRDKAISMWDVQTGEEVKVFPGPTAAAGACVVSPDGKYLAMSPTTLSVVVREIATNKEVFKSATTRSASLTFSADGKELIIVGLEPRTVGVVIQRVAIPDGTATPLSTKKTTQTVCQGFSGDGRFGVLAATDGTRNVVDLKTGRDLRPIGDKGPAGLPARRAASNFAYSFSADNRAVAGPGPNNTVCIWELATGKERKRFAGHKGAVLSTSFTPDGQKLVTASQDNTVLVWDLSYPGKDKPAPMKPDDLWDALASDDSGKAYTAVLQLLATPKEGIELVGNRLKPTVAVDEQKILQYVVDLDSEEFKVRKAAVVELENLGEVAEPYLRKALANKPPLEVKQRIEDLLKKIEARVLTADQLRGTRCVEFLEKLATPDAKAALEKLAKGPAGDKLTGWAQESLARLEAIQKKP